MKFTAVYKPKGAKLDYPIPIISVYADDKLDAERQIAIHLRGRPGHNWYKTWVDGGKAINN